MKKLLLLILLIWSNTLFAQVKLTGLIKNTDGDALEMANVIAVNNTTKSIDSYGFTDAFGNYELNVKKYSSYTIKVSYIGMKTSEIKIKTADTSIKKDIVLELDNTLDEVEIVAKMPILVKGDTIVYNTDSFKNGTEKKLGDVLEKLPGVEVNDNGEVKVQGKKVKKVMVEGKNFFDGDTKLATKNIPANAVDKVEVLKNHSDVAQMSRVTDNEDNTIINIKLKEGKKNFWFGNVSASIGMFRKDARYTANPNLFYYSPKGSINFIGNLNNIGKVPFTSRDYLKFSGGLKKSGSESTEINSISSDLSSFRRANDKAKEVHSKFGAANFSYEITPKWDISGFGIYSRNKTEIEDNTQNKYTKITSSKKVIDSEISEKQTTQKTDLGLVKLSSICKPNANNQLNYSFFGKLSNNQIEKHILSTRKYLNCNTEKVPVNETTHQNPYAIKQHLNYYKTLNDKHIFALEIQQAMQQLNPFYNAQVKQLSFVNSLGLNVQPKYDISQEKQVKTHKFDAKLNYYWMLNRTSNLNVTLGSTFSKQHFNSAIFETLENGTYHQLENPKTKNDINYLIKDFFVGLHYKFITGIFTFNQGFSLHQYTTKNTQLGNYTNHNFFRLLPDASVKIALKTTETLRLDYRQKVGFTNVNELAEGFVLNHYNSLYSGNRNLENFTTHNFNINYFNFNMFNYTNLYAFANYSRKINKITSTTIFEGIEQYSTARQTNLPEEMFIASAHFSKSYRKFKLNLGGGISYTSFNNFLFSPLDKSYKNQKSTSFNHNYDVRLRSNFRGNFEFDLGYKINLSNYKQGNVLSKYITQSPFVSFDVFFTDELIFNTKYTYNNYRNQKQTLNNYSFWDAELQYQKDKSKWRFSIEATNLLNTKSLNKNYSASYFSSTSQYIIQPRFVMFTVSYEL